VQILPLEAILFEDDFIRGIVPVLFADNPEVAEATLLAAPHLTRKDVMKLQKLFFAPEAIPASAAIQVFKTYIYLFAYKH
jgi:hypothetical protein